MTETDTETDAQRQRERQKGKSTVKEWKHTYITEREKERERDTERHRERDRERGRQTQRERGRRAWGKNRDTRQRKKMRSKTGGDKVVYLSASERRKDRGWEENSSRLASSTVLTLMGSHSSTTNLHT